MSVVMDNGGSGMLTNDPQQQNWIEQHPWITLAIGAIIAVVIARIFLTQKAAASKPNVTTAGIGSTGAVSGDTSGLSTDANGNPIVYVPTQDTFLNYNFASNSYNQDNPVNSNNTSTSTTTTTNNPPPITPPPPGPPPPTPVPPPEPTHSPPPTQTKGSWTCRYTVKEGDTLTAIANSFDTNWPAIYGHNTTEINLIAGAMHEIIPGGPWNNIRPGETLIVPCK